MPKVIKLENLKSYYKNGKIVFEEVTDYTCEFCRHLVASGNSFCWQCGKDLEDSDLVEHYYKGKKLSDEEYDILLGKIKE